MRWSVLLLARPPTVSDALARAARGGGGQLGQPGSAAQVLARTQSSQRKSGTCPRAALGGPSAAERVTGCAEIDMPETELANSRRASPALLELLLSRSSLSRSTTSAVMMASSARVGPCRRSLGSCPLCRSAKPAALCLLKLERLEPLPDKQCCERVAHLRAAHELHLALQRGHARGELAELRLPKRSHRRRPAQGSPELVLPGCVLCGIVRRQRRRTRQGLARAR